MPSSFVLVLQWEKQTNVEFELIPINDIDTSGGINCCWKDY